jgi:hypothetical protein
MMTTKQYEKLLVTIQNGLERTAERCGCDMNTTDLLAPMQLFALNAIRTELSTIAEHLEYLCRLVPVSELDLTWNQEHKKPDSCH